MKRTALNWIARPLVAVMRRLFPRTHRRAVKALAWERYCVARRKH